MFTRYLYQYVKSAGTEQIIIKKEKLYLLSHQLSRSVWLEHKAIETTELMHTNEYG
jgi:hypothetical protein